MEEKEGLLMYLPHELRQDFHYLSLRSSLLEEISLLYGRPLAAGNRIGRICRCRRLVRDFLAAWQRQPDQPEYPYLLGVLLERAGQLALTDQPGRAYDQAEQYYDRARKLLQRQPPGSYSRQQYLRPLLALLRRRWHYASLYDGRVFMGRRSRLTDTGAETENVPLPEALEKCLAETRAKLDAIE